MLGDSTPTPPPSLPPPPPSTPPPSKKLRRTIGCSEIYLDIDDYDDGEGALAAIASPISFDRVPQIRIEPVSAELLSSATQSMIEREAPVVITTPSSTTTAITTEAVSTGREYSQPSPAPTDSSVSTVSGMEKKRKQRQVCRKTTAGSSFTAAVATASIYQPSPLSASVSSELNRLKFTNPGKMNEDVVFGWNHGNVTRGFKRQHTHSLQTSSTG